MNFLLTVVVFFFSSRRRHTRFKCDWSSDVCSSDLAKSRSSPLPGRAAWDGAGWKMIGSWPSTAAQKGGDDMPEPLTSRQREILEYLRFRQKIRSYPPTVREIGEAVGLSSSSTVQNHLNTLERKGYIRRDPTKSRTIEVVDIDEMQAKLSKVVAVPPIGRVAAGQPILAQ